MNDAESLIERLQAEEVRLVDVRFTDLAGRWRHTSISAGDLSAADLEHGFMIDGSSVPGWRDPTEADVALRPDPSTAKLDPFAAQPTMMLIADVVDPATGQGYERCSRSIAARARAWLERHTLADRMSTNVATGYYIFDDVRIENGPGRHGVEISGSESDRAGGQAYASGNPGHRPQPSAARYALSPADHQSDIRAEITSILTSLGFLGIRHEHGQAPMQGRLAFQGGDPIATGDSIQLMKYVVQHVAASYGKSATFMARPLAESPGSGMNLLHSLWKKDKPIFAGAGYADLSPQCLAFIAGIMRHARTLNAFTNPTTNSYRRLRKKASEPVYLAYAAYNRSAAIRIPFAAEAAGKAMEIRFPDPTANPYLALAAVLMAGMDGIEQKLDPGDAMDRNLYDLGPTEVDDLPTVALSLRDALDALEQDQEFLLRGDVMSEDMIASYIAIKRYELERIGQAVVPQEYELYYSS